MLDKKGLGNFLKFKRKECHLTQKLAAYVVDLSDRALSNIENGRSMPEITTLCRLCDLYGTPLYEVQRFYVRSYEMNYAMNMPMIKAAMNFDREMRTAE